MLRLSLDVEERGEVTVVTLGGELDLGSAPRLRDVALRALLGGTRSLVLDLRELEFLDSTGLGTVVAILKRCRSLDAELQLVISRDRIRSPFAVTGVDGLIPIHAELESALA